LKLGINASFLSEKPTGAASFAQETARIISEKFEETIIFSPFIFDAKLSGNIYKVPAAIKGSSRLANSISRLFYINSILPLICRFKNIEVLYCPIMEFPFIPLVPTVVHVHDLHFIHFSTDFGLAAPRMKISLRFIKRAAKRVVVSSEFMKRELMEMSNIAEYMIDVVPLAYNSNLFKPASLEYREGFLSKYQIKGKYFLFIGSLFPYKNLKTLIDAFLKIKHLIPHCLVVVGRREFSQSPFIKDERILYVDYVPAYDMPFFYSYAEIFIYPSLREGFGIPPLEAMACGTPVISSNGGSLPETVGDAAILFDPLDCKMLAERIVEIVKNKSLKDELIQKGFGRVKNFSWEKTANGIIISCRKALKR
jgi:glycosyltransferase involved in cell wall biosynthesis